MKNRFVAFDFETANYYRNSACALGIVVVEDMKISEKVSFLIKPPRNYFTFTYIHNISWNDVKDKPTFEDYWPDISHYFSDVDFAVAHNASFDRSVFEGCCNYYGIRIPEIEYRCTCQLSRKYLNLKKNTLDSVSDHFGIKLNHHEALSDSVACAKIMIRLVKKYSCFA